MSDAEYDFYLDKECLQLEADMTVIFNRCINMKGSYHHKTGKMAFSKDAEQMICQARVMSYRCITDLYYSGCEKHKEGLRKRIKELILRVNIEARRASKLIKE